MLKTTRRTLTFTCAPIFKSFSRMLAQVASAIRVPPKPDTAKLVENYIGQH